MNLTVGPDFIGVGMERAGTTWLFKIVAAHPEIWVPPIKALHYFDRIEKGYSRDKSRFRRHIRRRIADRFPWARDKKYYPELTKNRWFKKLIWDLIYFRGRKSNSWYQKLFHFKFKKDRIAGEFTPSYAMNSPAIIKRMRADFPDAKIILMLRHPYHRLRSALFHHFKFEQGRRFHTVQDYEMKSYLKSEAVFEASSITRVLDKWMENIPEEKLFVCLQSDDMSEDVEEFLREIYDFLNVDPSFIPHEDLIGYRANSHLEKDADNELPDEIEHMIKRFAQEELGRLQKSYPHVAQIFAG